MRRSTKSVAGGATKVYALIGDPVEHSLSPVMFNAAFRATGIDAIYVAFKVKPEGLEDAARGIRQLGIAGVNVTTPHKSAVLLLLDEVSRQAREIEAVNTIHNVEGELVGYNTDGMGALKALESNVPNLSKKRIVIVGAGGAGRAIAHALAGRCRSVTILNRTKEKATRVAERLRRKGFDVEARGLSPEELRESLSLSDVLIHATAVGMGKPEESLIPKELLRSDLVVFDIVYHPLETKLLRDSKSVGAETINGIEMLIWQAAAFEIWTRKKAPVDVMRKAVLEQILGTF